MEGVRVRMSVTPSLVEVDNSQAWELLGRNPDFPHLFKCGYGHYYRPYPGMLVTSYQGQKVSDETGRMGLGMIVSVRRHPEPKGVVVYKCLVLWNYRHSLTI